MADLDPAILWQGDSEPIYGIGVVARMTGISVATLRIWERRYDFPSAGRTVGGHRLYSENEMARLRWVKTAIDAGMQTSQAIRSLRNYERQGRLPEVETKPALREMQPQTDRGAYEVFHQRLTAALLAGNLEQGDQVLAEMLAVFSLETLIVEVLVPTLNEIGEAWHSGRIHIATEHLASTFVRQRLFLWLTTGAPPYSIRPLVLACAPADWHEMGLLMLAVLLRRRRWPIAYLGQATPLPDLLNFISTLHPPLVVISASTREAVASLSDLASLLPVAGIRSQPLITFGGRGFNLLTPEEHAQLPGLYLGETLLQGVHKIEELLSETTALAV